MPLNEEPEMVLARVEPVGIAFGSFAEVRCFDGQPYVPRGTDAVGYWTLFWLVALLLVAGHPFEKQALTY